MKIYLFGYGGMGREVETAALARGHEIFYIQDPSLNHPFDHEKLKSSTAAIEFTTPATAFENILECFQNGIPVICGTTGWYDRLPEVEEACKKYDGTILYSPNFSLGVNLFFKLNEYLARIMSANSDYNVSVSEVHHTRKKDFPSGTALSIANTILRENSWKNEILVLQNGENSSGDPGTLDIFYERRDDVPGIHEVSYVSAADRITIRHEAFNRKGLALGTILATEWVVSKKGIFTMKDFLQHLPE